MGDRRVSYFEPLLDTPQNGEGLYYNSTIERFTNAPSPIMVPFDGPVLTTVSYTGTIPQSRRLIGSEGVSTTVVGNDMQIKATTWNTPFVTTSADGNLNGEKVLGAGVRTTVNTGASTVSIDHTGAALLQLLTGDGVNEITADAVITALPATKFMHMVYPTAQPSVEIQGIVASTCHFIMIRNLSTGPVPIRHLQAGVPALDQIFTKTGGGSITLSNNQSAMFWFNPTAAANTPARWYYLGTWNVG